VESPLGESLFDGLHRVRVAHGAVSSGADLAKTVQFGVKVGLRLSNALVARSDVGRAAGLRISPTSSTPTAEPYPKIDSTERSSAGAEQVGAHRLGATAWGNIGLRIRGGHRMTPW
jgi:hypothetical protein